MLENVPRLSQSFCFVDTIYLGINPENKSSWRSTERLCMQNVADVYCVKDLSLAGGTIPPEFSVAKQYVNGESCQLALARLPQRCWLWLMVISWRAEPGIERVQALADICIMLP